MTLCENCHHRPVVDGHRYCRVCYAEAFVVATNHAEQVHKEIAIRVQNDSRLHLYGFTPEEIHLKSSRGKG